jgi:hypothetical protein
MTLQAIADELGYAGHAGARKAVKAGMADIVREPAEDLCLWQMERLDAMQLAIWDSVEAGDLKAIETMLKIMSRRARLAGLDGYAVATDSEPEQGRVAVYLPFNFRGDPPDDALERPPH